jgi:putative glutamine amidotransferase
MQKRDYFDAITASGGVPLPLPILPSTRSRQLYELCDAVLLPGGKDVDPATYGADPLDPAVESLPELDPVELELITWARDDRKPLLGICRGAQLLNVGLGGTLWPDLDRDRGAGHPHGAGQHEVAVTPGSALAIATGYTRLTVNSRHHQAVRTLGQDLTAVAHAADGVIEAIEVHSRDWFALGVQWHPEELPGDNPAGHLMIGSLVRAALGRTARLA